MKRDLPDFHAVRPEHLDIHDSLCNWARVVRVHLTSGGNCQPMFRQYRTANYSFDKIADVWVDDTPKRPPPDLQAGWRMERAVRHLPEKERAAVRWHYVYPVQPHKMARCLAVTPLGLHDLVHAGRSMLKNRC